MEILARLGLAALTLLLFWFVGRFLFEDTLLGAVVAVVSLITIAPIFKRSSRDTGQGNQDR